MGTEIHFRKTFWLGALLLGTLLLFYPICEFEFLNWDDPQYLTEHPWYFPVQWKSIFQMWSPLSLWKGVAVDYAPVRDMSYVVDWLVWGFNSKGFHFTQLCLHILNTFLLATLLMGFLHWPYAIAASALWSWHPLVVEPVSWVSSRKDLLMTVFFLSALLFLRAKKYRVSLGFGLASILSKFPGAVLGVIGLLPCWGKYASIRKRFILCALWSFVGVSVVFLLITANLQLDKVIVSDGVKSWYQNWPAAFQVVTHVFEKILFPIHLSARYVQDPNLTWISWRVLLGICLAFVLVFFSFPLIRKNHPLAGPTVFFGAALFPYLPIVPTNIWMADRYIYLALCGFVWAIGWSVQKLDEKLTSRFMLSLLWVWALGFAWLSYQRIPVWKDSISLWSSTTKTSSSLYYVWGNLGMAYLKEEQVQPAIKALKKSIDLNPSWSVGHLWLARAYLKANQMNEGREQLEVFERISSKREKREQLGIQATAWAELGEFEKAESLFQLYFKIRSNDPLAWVNYGVLLAQRGEEQSAIKAWRKAIELDPYQSGARLNLAKYWYFQGQCQQMRKEFKFLRKPNRTEHMEMQKLESLCHF